MKDHGLLKLSPIDGRYADKTGNLPEICSEFGLVRNRVRIEIAWFRYLAGIEEITELPTLSTADDEFLQKIWRDFSVADAKRIKVLENTINHDVKAVEYWLKERIGSRPELSSRREFIHFACTSDDINNLAYALMLQQARDQVLLPAMVELAERLAGMARQHAHRVMPARTHGQVASPTTLGKELANHAFRLRRQARQFAALPLPGKMNGAVGNYNAHVCAYPEIDWPARSEDFVTGLGLAFNPYTTQIEPHDGIVEYCQTLRRFNRIVLDFNRDTWGYIALGYFAQETSGCEVGSSTMPHKINPINFENSEGNLGIANAIADHLADALPVSRWQRDLSDTTRLRNLGVFCAHSLLAWRGTVRGLDKLRVVPTAMERDLDNAWELLGEPIQTLMRKHGIDNPYERLRRLTQGRSLARDAMHELCIQLELPAAARETVASLTPAGYGGLAARLASAITEDGFRVTQVPWTQWQTILQAIRHEVFIEEQSVPIEDEWDGLDAGACHFLAQWGDRKVGTARLLPSGQIGRMAVCAPWRLLGIGARLLEAAVKASTARKQQPFLHAQTHASGFYLRNGFVPVGDEFLESGIVHVKMVPKR